MCSTISSPPSTPYAAGLGSLCQDTVFVVPWRQFHGARGHHSFCPVPNVEFSNNAVHMCLHSAHRHAQPIRDDLVLGADGENAQDCQFPRGELLEVTACHCPLPPAGRCDFRRLSHMGRRWKVLPAKATSRNAATATFRLVDVVMQPCTPNCLAIVSTALDSLGSGASINRAIGTSGHLCAQPFDLPAQPPISPLGTAGTNEYGRRRL